MYINFVVFIISILEYFRITFIDVVDFFEKNKHIFSFLNLSKKYDYIVLPLRYIKYINIFIRIKSKKYINIYQTIKSIYLKKCFSSKENSLLIEILKNPHIITKECKKNKYIKHILAKYFIIFNVTSIESLFYMMLSTENNFCTNKQLTNTENLILKLISSGLPRYKIGRKMLLNKNNYFYYIKQIQKKLNVNNIFEAIILTLQENNQYVDPDDLIKTLKKCEINIKICANISGL